MHCGGEAGSRGPPLYLPDRVFRALKAHRVRQLQERLAAGSRWQDSGLVFASSIGTSLEPRNLFRAFKALLRKAGLPNVRFHDLRHSAASLLLAQGVPMRALMELLGHSSIGTTADIYSDVVPAMMRDVAGKMETVLSGPVNQARQEVGVKIVRFEPDGCQNGCQNESDTYLERQKALILLARPEGFEPPTHRSVVCCSNPLS